MVGGVDEDGAVVGGGVPILGAHASEALKDRVVDPARLAHERQHGRLHVTVPQPRLLGAEAINVLSQKDKQLGFHGRLDEGALDALELLHGTLEVATLELRLQLRAGLLHREVNGVTRHQHEVRQLTVLRWY